jgi:hypothetical protein
MLVDRLPEGLRLNAAGEQLVAAAESVEDAVLTSRSLRDPSEHVPLLGKQPLHPIDYRAHAG